MRRTVGGSSASEFEETEDEEGEWVCFLGGRVGDFDVGAGGELRVWVGFEVGAAMGLELRT